MKLSSRSTLRDIAGAVTSALEDSGIRAVLTGGACATIYSEGEYQSNDLDFILQSDSTRRQLDDAMASIGFTRERDHYVHPNTEFFVEFPRGPLAIGRDSSIRPSKLKIGNRGLLALSATDSCRDRLAAFYFWDDLSSLRAAVAIARRQRVNRAAIRRWSDAEGHLEKFRLFQREYERARK